MMVVVDGRFAADWRLAVAVAVHCVKVARVVVEQREGRGFGARDCRRLVLQRSGRRDIGLHCGDRGRVLVGAKTEVELVGGGH